MPGLTLWGDVLCSIDEGVGGEKLCVVRSSQNYRNCVELQSIESLLCNVITTNSVLEADEKSKNIALLKVVIFIEEMLH